MVHDIVRNPKMQRDAWHDEPKAFADLTEKEMEKIVQDVHYLREFPRERITIESHDGLKLAGHLFAVENPRGIVIMAHGYRSSAPFDFEKNPSAPTTQERADALIEEIGQNVERTMGGDAERRAPIEPPAHFKELKFGTNYDHN